MERKMIFRNIADGREMNLPVTPQGFRISHGINIETVNINGVGDVNLAGFGTLATIQLELLFPAKKYDFVTIAVLPEPYAYVDTIRRFIDEHLLIRLIVTGTTVNIPVLFESIEYEERDGTNDVYATVTLREYRELRAGQEKEDGTAGRTEPENTAKEQSYKIAKGDTLGSICRKFYGDASLYPKLAAANGIKNPNLIYAGATIRIPERSRL